MITALDLAIASRRVYEEPPTWKVGDMHALVVRKEGHFILAIRGTTLNPEDWLRDLAIWPTRDRHIGFVHKGFYDGALALLYHSPLRDDQMDGIYLAGHSMGGATAIIIAALMRAHKMSPSAVMAFGPPRCVSWKAKRLLRNVDVRLFKVGNDPVPDVPYLPPVYVHPRPLIKMGRPVFDPFADHHIDRYVQELEKHPQGAW